MFKKIGIFSFVLFGMLSCSNDNKSNASEKKTIKKEVEIVKEKEENSSLKENKLSFETDFYALEFFNTIEVAYPNTEIQLKDKSLYLGKKKYKLPQIFPQDKKLIFKGNRDDVTASLQVKQINYTSLEYEFTYIEKGKTKLKNKGTAHLSPNFFKDSELDEDDLNSEMYPATEFIDQAFSQTFLRVSNELNDENELRIRVIAIDNKGNEVDLLPITLRGKLK